MAFEHDIQRIMRQIRPGIMGVNNHPTRNLYGVIDDLKANPKWLAQLQSEAQLFLAKLDYIPALTESGMMTESGFFSEMFRKVEYKFLPKAMDDLDFLAFLGRVYDAAGGADWVEKIKVETIAEFLTLVFPDASHLLDAVGPQLFQALEIMGLRLAYYGVETEVYTRLKDRPDLRQAFMKVQNDLRQMLEVKDNDRVSLVYEDIRLCREAVQTIRAKRAAEGISLGLTFHMMRIQELCSRMEMILGLLESILGTWNPMPTAILLKEVMVNETKRFDLTDFVRRNVQLLAFQITEHTGRAGEHYITTTRSEYKAMFVSASIGGALVALITIIKCLIAMTPLAPVPMALSYSLLYAAGFVAIHTFGGTLASKQPAMTASRIAAALDDAKTSEQALGNLTEMIVRTIRSQLIALLGNYLIAFPVAFLICTAFAAFHFPLIPHVKAEHLLHDLHPWKSGSLWFAAIAGCCLFSAGIIAGATDNWFVFNRVGKRLEGSSLLRRFVAPYNLRKAINVIENNIGFWSGNVSLGFFLGSMGLIGMMFGLPIDIRHVTFSSGQLGVALAHMPGQVPWSEIALTAATVFCIGLTNLAVSFSLTLYLTMRSRQIRFRQTRELIRLCLRHLRRRPMDFFFPPSDAMDAA